MRCDEIGTKQTKQEFVDFLNSIKGGQFFHIRGYVNSEGEKADHWLRFGIKYPNLKIRDIGFLQDVLAGDRSFKVKVTHGVWVRDELLTMDKLFSDTESSGESKTWATVKFSSKTVDGNIRTIELTGCMNLLDVVTFGNRKAAGKTQVTLSYELSSTHPLVIAAIGASDLQGTILQGLVNPHESNVEYDAQAKSCYSLEQAGMPARWYFRDVLSVAKVVRVQGNYEFKASLPINAVKKAITSQFLLTGKYRQFILTDGQFESITIEGQAIMVDGVEEEFYFALPSDVREAAKVSQEAVLV